jgi:parallel beta-helix repeat protein
MCYDTNILRQGLWRYILMFYFMKPSRLCVLAAMYIILVVLIAGSFFSGEALAATLDVPTNYPTIQKAIDAAGKGDKVRVSQGTYLENITMKEGVTLEGGWNKDLSRRDFRAFETIIDGKKKAGWTVLGANGATLDGFTIINATRLERGGADTGAGIHCESASPTIVNNTIKGNAPAGIYCTASSAVISNNVISNNEEAGIYLENGCSLKIEGNIIRENKMAGIGSGGMVASTIEVRNNVINNNEMAGIEGKGASAVIYNNIIYANKQAGIRCVKAMEIVNNTVVANGRSGVIVEDPSLIPIIKNNILSHNKDAGISASGQGYSCNLLFANNNTENMDPKYLMAVRRNFGGYEDEESYLKLKSIIGDPLFVDAIHHDYHLQPASPAIDAGDPDPKFHDINFPPSLGSELNDMGAYGGPFARPEERKPNDPPKAHAGQAQQVFAGDRVTLDGSESSDPNGDSLSYLWELVSKPQGSQASLSKPEAVKSRLKTDLPGDYTARLVVKDRWGKSSEPHSVRITAVANHPPTANAGEVISNVYVGDRVTLYGGGSKDPDGDPLAYRWELTFKPSDSRASLSDPRATSPTFVVDAVGCYAVNLVVNDGKVDSEPDTVYVSTKHRAVDGKRNVPAEYPTIQSAIDAADSGDKIIVQKGIYKENIVIDKTVDLIGIDWPTIDGGSLEGDRNAVMIPYLGDKAGKVEGFIVTGGGSGGMGHGINVWDSSPTITNNKVNRNAHVGIGVHGRPILTSKTEIYNNEIFENLVGIGNGAGGNPHIYRNRIYNNRIVGVGSRGNAEPRIEENEIYGNHIGVGAREVASPSVEGNHIFDNAFGITISPVSTVRAFAGKDIIMKNNLIFNNYQCGISVTSFNLSKVIITNNTIDANNHQWAKTIRGGGIMLGWPSPGTFTAVVQDNIITNNKIAGLVNYTGTELFPGPGVTIINKYNDAWNNENDYVGCSPGDKGFSKDPLFVSMPTEKNGNYYLSQRAAGQQNDSPGLDAGSDTAAKLDLENKTTRIDKAGDTGAGDIGYHYPKSSM